MNIILLKPLINRTFGQNIINKVYFIGNSFKLGIQKIIKQSSNRRIRLNIQKKLKIHSTKRRVSKIEFDSIWIDKCVFEEGQQNLKLKKL